MCKIYKLLALALLPIISSCLAATLPDGKAGLDATGQQLVVVLLDGFRWNYVDIYKEDLPGFGRFLNEGVQAEWVETVFPSNSYANWATISTGLYPESNQFLGNHMFDRNETDPGQQFFSLDHPQTEKLLKWWQDVESIWTTATRLGKRVFLRYWSRCEVPYKGILPEECEGYGGEYDIEDTKRSFNLTLRKLQEGFDLLMVHVDRIDLTGHDYGPMSVQMLVELKKVDAVLNDFLDRLQLNGLDEQVNVILVSDHGMRYVGEGSGTQYVDLDDFLDPSEVVYVMDRGTHASVAVVENSLQNAYTKLKSAQGLDVYLRDEIPEKYHYKHGKYVLDILLVPKKGYLIRGLLKTDKQVPETSNPNVTYDGGNHGYAPEVSDMRAIFFARGPAFKKGTISAPIHMVDIYQLYGPLLNITLQPHNGTWDRVADMLV